MLFETIALLLVERIARVFGRLSTIVFLHSAHAGTGSLEKKRDLVGVFLHLLRKETLIYIFKKILRNLFLLEQQI